MAKKTFKIGEYCKGGVISVDATQQRIVVTISYPNGTILNQGNFNPSLPDEKRRMDFFINDHTTAFYTDKVMKWIESKVKFHKYEF
jgi:hypothetical protein